MKKAVLFIIFNRLETTKEVFNQIKLAKPPRLYIASDGARTQRPNETQIVNEIRNWVLDNIDWECQINTLFRNENMGCNKNIPDAINWFFSHEEDGIILEDDCVPNQSFFQYCELALNKYKSNKNIWHITGTNATNIKTKNESSINLSKCMICWGWATWADRWKYFNANLENYDITKIAKTFKYISHQIYWLRILYRDNNNIFNSWDYKWALNIIHNNGICISPYKNLICNIGYEGTHYSKKKKSKTLAKQKSYNIEQITLPDNIIYSCEYDIQLFQQFYRIKSFLFKFILKLIYETITLKFDKESHTIVKQLLLINKKEYKC